MASSYIHGFSTEERERLRWQARFAESRVYQGVDFSDCARILEPGCGVGAQSERLLRRFPGLHVTGVDLHPRQLAAARDALASEPSFAGRFTLEEMDATDLAYPDGHFDGLFLCWFLEHVPDPAAVLREARRVLRPGARVCAAEVMNFSFFLHPASPHTWRYWEAFNAHQAARGGDPFVGAKLGNLLLETGFRDIETSTRVFHFDDRRAEERREAVAFWLALLLSAAPQLLEAGRVSADTVEGMKRECATAGEAAGAVFHYAFMHARARA